MRLILKPAAGVLLSALVGCGSDSAETEPRPASETGNAYTDSLKQSRDSASAAAAAMESAAQRRSDATEEEQDGDQESR